MHRSQTVRGARSELAEILPRLIQSRGGQVVSAIGTNPVRFTVVASSSLPSQLELPAQLELMGYDICYAGQSTRFEPFVYATLCSEARGSELVVRIDRRPGVLEVSTYVVVLPEQKPHHEVIEWRAILLRRKSPNGTKRRSAAAH